MEIQSPGKLVQETVEMLGKNFTILELQQKLSPHMESPNEKDLEYKDGQKSSLNSFNAIIPDQCENCGKSREQNDLNHNLLWCRNCEAAYCSACFDLLHENKVMSRHTKQEAPRGCAVHKKTLDLFCFEDHEIVCRDCISTEGKHYKHKSGKVTEAAMSLRNTVKNIKRKSSLANEALVKISDDLKVIKAANVEKTNQVEAATLNLYSKLYSCLQAHQSRLLCAATVGFGEKLSVMDEKLNKIGFLVDKIQRLEEELDQNYRETDNIFLKSSISLTTDLHQLIITAGKIVQSESKRIQEGSNDLSDPFDSFTSTINLLTGFLSSLNDNFSKIPEVTQDQIEKFYGERKCDPSAKEHATPNLPPIESLEFSVRSSNRSQFTLDLSWEIEEVKNDDLEAPFQPEFIVQQREECIENKDSIPDSWMTVLCTQSHGGRIDNLKSGLTYSFRVCYRTRDGFSPWTDGIVVNSQSSSGSVSRSVSPQRHKSALFDENASSIGEPERKPSKTVDILGIDQSERKVDFQKQDDKAMENGFFFETDFDADLLIRSQEGELSEEHEDDEEVQEEWDIPPENVREYASLYPMADIDDDGFLSGRKAVEFFAQSQLTKENLRAIWQLADRNGDNQLDLDEFIIAMHLIISLKKKDKALPKFLPRVLSEFTSTSILHSFDK